MPGMFASIKYAAFCRTNDNQHADNWNVVDNRVEGLLDGEIFANKNFDDKGIDSGKGSGLHERKIYEYSKNNTRQEKPQNDETNATPKRLAKAHQFTFV